MAFFNGYFNLNPLLYNKKELYLHTIKKKEEFVSHIV